jgi:inhibitor of KinA
MTPVFDKPRIRVNGDRSILVEYGDAIDPAVNEKVRAMTELLRKASLAGIHLILPAYRSIGIVYDPLSTSPLSIGDALAQLESELATAIIPEPRTVEIPVCYGGDFGPDIEFVARHNHITVEAVIDIHSSGPYRIYTIGFAPGFFYLGGLDNRLHTPRLETPRMMVRAGSVGIAETQTGAYPLDSPGGWRIIGRTPLKLFDAGRQNPFLYQAGDSIRFRPISEAAYRRLERGGDA